MCAELSVSGVLAGGGEEWTPGPPPSSCTAAPQHVSFSASWKNKNKTTWLAMDQSGATLGTQLSVIGHISGGPSGWSCFLSPVACLAGSVLVLSCFEKCQLISTSLQPGVGWWGHKPGPRTLVLGALVLPPRPKGGLWRPNAPASAPRTVWDSGALSRP